MRGIRVAACAVLLVVAACGDSGGETTTVPPETAAPTTSPPATAAPTTTTTSTTTTTTTTTLPPTTTTVAPTTTVAADAIVINEPDADGVVAVDIDGEQLDDLYDQFMPGDDPLYLVHTQQDDIFVGVELYTVFGDGWTGELGTFPTDCTTHGICVYLDPDGVGPLEGGGPGTGEITVTQLAGDDGPTIVTIDMVEIVAGDGQVYTISGLTLTG